MNILKFALLSKKSMVFAAFLAIVIPFVTGGQAKALDTLSLRRGEALSTSNSSSSRLYGQPRMTVSRHDVYNRDQQFSIRDMRDGSFQFRQQSTNKCLNAYRPRRGSLVNVWTCRDSDMDQRFIKESVGNRVLLKSKNNPSFCLDASHVERGLVHLYNCDRTNENQLWKITPIFNRAATNLPSVVTIVNRATDQIMDGGGGYRGNDVYGHGRRNGRHLKNTYQQWELRRIGSYYMLVNKQTGRVLEASRGNTTNKYMNASMRPKPERPNDYQLWRIEQVGGDRYVIISKATGFALDGGGTNVGQDSIYLYQQPNRNNSWHQWKIEGVEGSGRGTDNSNSKAENFFSWARGQRGISRLDRSNYRGQCVTLAVRYLQDVYFNGSTAWRAYGDGKDVAFGVASQHRDLFRFKTSGVPKRGSIISFRGYPYNLEHGHVGIVLESNSDGSFTMLDSNSDSQGPGSIVKVHSNVSRRGVVGWAEPINPLP